MSAKRHPTPRSVQPGRKGPTLKDVGAYLGLSPATVSLVINQSPGSESIPKETQRRVLAAVEKLGYRPNLVARSLRSRRSSTVGILVPEISEGYATGVLSGVENLLLSRGYFYLLASHQFDERLVRENLDLLKDRLVEGLILINTRTPMPPGLPTVVVSGHRRERDVVNVIIDHDRAASLALEHLAALGHRKIAVLRGHPWTADAEIRWRSIERAAKEHGLEIPAGLTLQIGDPAVGADASPEIHYREGYLYGKRLLAAENGFTAFFAFNDISAIGAIKAFHDAGLRVPEDISVVGFDDIEVASFHNPGLTTVRQPLQEMGEIAADLLLAWLAGERPEEDFVTVEPELVVRSSTGPASDPARV
jgi:LacI family transcriptional regulator